MNDVHALVFVYVRDFAAVYCTVHNTIQLRKMIISNAEELLICSIF